MKSIAGVCLVAGAILCVNGCLLMTYAYFSKAESHNKRILHVIGCVFNSLGMIAFCLFTLLMRNA